MDNEHEQAIWTTKATVVSSLVFLFGSQLFKCGDKNIIKNLHRCVKMRLVV